MLRDLGREGTRVHVTGVADRARRDLATARWWAFLWSKLGFGKKQAKVETLLLGGNARDIQRLAWISLPTININS